MGAFAEFEHALIRERQAEGSALAKQRGVYQGGRPRALTDDAVAAVRQWIVAGESQTAIARELGVHRTTLYLTFRT
jgi:DNA invertase Pin-like site-specific DNA recombinase